MATGNDVSSQRSERAADNGNACCGLDLDADYNLRELDDISSLPCVVERNASPIIRETFFNDPAGGCSGLAEK